MAAGEPPSGRRASGRREHRKHLTRRELLAAGRRLFAEKGLYDARIEDLSRQAGVAKGTLYGYFASKEDLIEAVVTNGLSELLGHVHRAAQGADSRDEAVARVAEAHLAFFEENPDLMRVFHQVRGILQFDRLQSHTLRQLLVKYLTGLAQVLALYPPARAGREPDELQVAALLFGAISGITSVRAATKGALSGPGGPRAVVRALVGLIRAFGTSASETTRRPPRARRRDAQSERHAGSPRPAEGPPRRRATRVRR